MIEYIYGSRQGGRKMKNGETQNSMSRKKFTAEQKFKIVKEHLTCKTPISELCKKYGMSAMSFYGWQEQFFSGAFQGFNRKRGPQERSGKSDSHIQTL